MKLMIFNILVKILNILNNYSSLVNLDNKKKLTISNQTVQISKESSIQNLQNNPKKIVLGDYSYIRGELLIFSYGGFIEIGEYCYIGENTRIWSSNSIKIGNRVLISHNVNIHDSNSHPISYELRHKHFKEIITKGHPLTNPGILDSPIEIGDDVWIGFNVSILKGVKIGNGSIISANSIITENIPEFSKVKMEKKLSIKPI
jgi:maltose O-acetyltransferase